MTTLILQLSPITLKKDETDWINDEVRFTVLVAGPNMGQAQTEKFQVFRYENERYEKFLFWKRDLLSFFEEAAFSQNPHQKFKYVMRTLKGESKSDWKTLIDNMNANLGDQNDYVRVMCAFTKMNLPENPSGATLTYLREKAKLPEAYTIKAWIARLKTINSMLPLMQVDFNVIIQKLTELELRDIILKNLPSRYITKLSESGLNPNSTISEVQQKLMVYEANFEKSKRLSDKQTERKKRTEVKKATPEREKKEEPKKKFANMCRIHKTHEWSECRSNPKNKNKEERKPTHKEESHETSKKKKSEHKEEKHSMRRRRSSRRSRHRRSHSSDSSSSGSSYSLYEILSDNDDDSISSFEEIETEESD